MNKFVKGQIVYCVSEHFDIRDDVQIGAVISRTVDSCGKKFMTFVNFGFDSAFGRRSALQNGRVFADASAAFEFLKQLNAVGGYVKNVHTDQNGIVFDKLKNNTLEIVMK